MAGMAPSDGWAVPEMVLKGGAEMQEGDKRMGRSTLHSRTQTLSSAGFGCGGSGGDANGERRRNMLQHTFDFCGEGLWTSRLCEGLGTASHCFVGLYGVC